MSGATASLALLALLNTTQAQDSAAGPDWDVFRDTSKTMVMAYTDFDSGLGIAVRCVDQSYEALISGLPDIAGDTRTLRLAFSDDELHDSTWNVAIDPTIAVSDRPAPFARNLREGGQLQIVVPGGAADGRNLRYVLTLPPSSAAIDETLTSCGRPLIDPRDAELEDIAANGLPASLSWDRAPRPRYPVPARYGKGFAVVTCLTNPDGSLRDCLIETEHPQDGAFGDSVLRSIRRARVRNTSQEGAVPLQRISFRAAFRLEGYTEALRSPSRIRTPESGEASE